LVLSRSFDFESEEAAMEMIRKWHANGQIWYAEPNYKSELFRNSFDTYLDQYQSIPSRTSNAYWHDRIRLLQAYEYLSSQGQPVGSPNHCCHG
jgi:hypothetical protein